MDFFPLISQMNTLWTVAGVGLIVHLIFKRTETFRFSSLFILLLATPACLTVLYLPHVNNSIVLAVSNVFGLFWSTLITSILLYRASPWHPLAKYPGPLICKLSKFYLAFLSLRGRQHIYYSQLHKKYGDVVRVGPNELSICNVDAVTPLMGPNGLEKGPFWSGRVPAQTVMPLVTIVDKTEHARRRRSWTRAFTTTALKGYEGLVKDRSLQLVDTLASKNLKETQNLTEWFSFFAHDVVMDLAFGGSSEMMRDGDIEGFWRALGAGLKEAVFVSHVPWLSSIAFPVPGFMNNLKIFRARAGKCARRRVKEGSTTHKDLFYHLMDEDNLATIKPTTPEVMSDAALAMLAGSDTTSSAATNILYFLISHPTTYKRLQAEIDGLGDKLTDCTAQAQLPYLNAVIHESLRLLPPVLSGVQRAAEKGSGGSMVGSVYLPEGNYAFIHTYSLQRDPRCFAPLSDSFIPERWLSEDLRRALEPKIFNSETEFVHNTAAFIPFSIGPANCAGKNFAWMELRMVATLMASRFDFAFEPGYNPLKWYDDIRDYFNMEKGQLPARLSIRKA